ncbi:MAG: TMEM143 family protein [Bradyrhizobium sp.]|uniref:TMEM143 family protein n=1 Tax=Bradyrhizobium sp. TaxID=376 RepID=UPI002730498A|nr:TMEM143 family protein [Bradyrhizobium sp.]MDP1869653.1 TMEM143 family protein [Bradyrhizobium sp.]
MDCFASARNDVNDVDGPVEWRNRSNEAIVCGAAGPGKIQPGNGRPDNASDDDSSEDGSFVNGVPGETAVTESRDRFIPLRKSDLIDGLLAADNLDDGGQARFRQFARQLGALFHYQYFEQLDLLREAYFHFDPEVDPRIGGPQQDNEAAYRRLSEEVVRVLTEANFIEITHDEIISAFAEHALVRVKLKAPVEEYRDVRMFRRGSHQETVEIPVWRGLRKRSHEIEVFDDVVMMVATRPGSDTPADARKVRWSGKRSSQKIRGGAVLFKYFRHVARADLEALFPNVRVVMSLSDQLMLGVPAIFGGIPILIKLASTMVILFLVAGFYLGVNGTLGDNDLEQALAALSGLFALGAFLLRQRGNFHRQSLIHQKQLTDNVYYRNINNNSGIFSYLIGEAEEQECKEALLAYYCLAIAGKPVTRAVLGASIEALLSHRFSVSADFAIDEAATQLQRLGLLDDSGGMLSALPLPAAIERLEAEWAQLLQPSAGSR